MQALPHNNPPARPAGPGWYLTGWHSRAGWCRCLGVAVGGWLVFSLPLSAASPILEINRSSPHAVRLAWPATERNWVVEGGADLSRMATVLTAPRIEGDRIALTVPATEPAFFWRLRSQVTAGAAGGRNFLRDSQNDAGQWGVAGQPSVLYSAGALEALHQLGWADPSFDGVVGFGLDALGYAATRNNDELSRKIIALATGGRPVTSLVDELLGAQNPELPEATSLAYPGFAWGVAPALGGTVIDTALALRALEAARAPGAGLGLSVVREAVPAGATSAGYPFAVPAGATAMDLHIRSLSGNARFDFLRPDSSTSYFNATPGGVPVHVNFGDPTPGEWTMTAVNNAGAPIVCSAEVTFTTAEGADISRLTGAVSYLGLAQNADGGWGMSAGMDSQLMIT